MATFRQLRKDQRFPQAIQRLLDLCRANHANAAKRVREQLFADKCLLLDWARSMIRNKRRVECGDTIPTLRSHLLPHTQHCKHPLLARLALIEALTASRGDASTLEEAIRLHIQTVEAHWHYIKHPDVEKAEATEFLANPADLLAGPSLLAQLPDDATRRLFQVIAQDSGWTHPGLLLAGEAIAWIEGKAKRAEHKVTTWIMFAAKESNQGVLARLVIERLSSGRGLLVPDPRTAGYHFMDADFSTGFQHAWLAARMVHKFANNCDFR